MQLRVTVPADRTEQVRDLFADDPGTAHLAVLPGASVTPAGDLVLADVARESADGLVAALRDLGIDRDGGIAMVVVDAADDLDGTREVRARQAEVAGHENQVRRDRVDVADVLAQRHVLGVAELRGRQRRPDQVLRGVDALAHHELGASRGGAGDDADGVPVALPVGVDGRAGADVGGVQGAGEDRLDDVGAGVEHLRRELGGFNRLMQHQAVGETVVARRRPRRGSSSPGPCAAGR